MGFYKSLTYLFIIFSIVIVAFGIYALFYVSYTDEEINQSAISSAYGKTYSNAVLYADSELNRFVRSSVSDSGPSYSNNYITRTYTWTYNWHVNTITLQIPEGHYDYYKNRSHTRNYSSYALSEYDQQLLSSMISGFKQQGQQNGYSDYDNVMNVVAFVQSLPYTSDSVTTGYDEYPRFPIETLVDDGGDCEDSSILAAALLSEMGYGTVLLSPPNHMALGIKGSDTLPGTYYTYNGSRYYYVETTASGWSLGELPTSYSGSSVKIYPMNNVKPAISATFIESYLATDFDYAYYTVRCYVENTGPSTAQNVNISLFSLSTDGAKDPTQITHNVSLGTISDGEFGSAEAVFKLPRNSVARFGYVVKGSNFNSLSGYEDTFLVNPQTTLKADMTWTRLDSDFKYAYYKIRCNVTNTGNSFADNVSVRIIAESPPYNMTKYWVPGHTIDINIIQEDDSEWVEAIVRIPRDQSSVMTCIINGKNFDTVTVHSPVISY